MKRYSLGWIRGQQKNLEMYESSEGEWVKWEDIKPMSPDDCSYWNGVAIRTVVKEEK